MSQNKGYILLATFKKRRKVCRQIFFSKRVEPPEAPQAKIFEENCPSSVVVVEAVEVNVAVVVRAVGEFFAIAGGGCEGGCLTLHLEHALFRS